MRFIAGAACVALIALACGFTLLAIIFTGGDSAFANESGWIYTPWLAAVMLSIASTVAALIGTPAVALALAGAATLAYTATWFIWPN